MVQNNKSCNIKYGYERMRVAIEVSKILDELKACYFLDSGSLLGAHRSKELIANDDDFDFGIYFERDIYESRKLLKRVYSKLSDIIPNQYQCRILTFSKDYADKIEIFDPAFGNYQLEGDLYNGANFHHVTCDIQLYFRAIIETRETIKISHLQTLEDNILPSVLCLMEKIPLETISKEKGRFCKYEFNAPIYENRLKLLKNIYGSISEKAKYNKKTKKYEL